MRTSRLKHTALVAAAWFMAAHMGAAQEQQAYVPPPVTPEMEALELEQLGAARSAAIDYAMSCPETRDCVGIVFHIGDEIRYRVDQEVLAYFEPRNIEPTAENMARGHEIMMQGYIDHYTAYFAEKFSDPEIVGEGREMQISLFPRQDFGNNGKLMATTVSYHIGDTLYHTSSDRTYIRLDTDAIGEIGRVREALDYVWQQIADEND